MAIGAMRNRLEIQSRTRVTDGAGGASIEWTRVADTYADIQPQSVAESVFGRDNEMREVGRYKIYIRYRDDVSHKSRLVHTFSREGVSYTKYYNIRGVLNVDNRYKILELLCEEGVPT